MPTDAEGLPPEFYAPENAQDRCPHPYKQVRRVEPTWYPHLLGRDMYCECKVCGKGWWERK